MMLLELTEYNGKWLCIDREGILAQLSINEIRQKNIDVS